MRIGKIADLPAAAALLYVETSGLLAGLLEGESRARRTLTLDLPALTSTLTVAEAARALQRAEHARRYTPEQLHEIRRALDQFQRRSALFPMTDAVLAAVGLRFPVEPVRILDAIHLVTAQMLGLAPGEVLLLSRDRRLRANAAALGFLLD
jgi:predicted nucleic acid-binding protein